jgi:hypothetical protein
MRRRRPNKSHEQDAKRSKECNKWTQYLSITCMCQSEDRKAEAERKTNRHNCLLIAQSTRGTLVDSSKEGDLLPSNLSSVNAEDGGGEKDRQSLHAAKRRNDPANSRAEIEGNAYTHSYISSINIGRTERRRMFVFDGVEGYGEGQVWEGETGPSIGEEGEANRDGEHVRGKVGDVEGFGARGEETEEAVPEGGKGCGAWCG